MDGESNSLDENRSLRDPKHRVRSWVRSWFGHHDVLLLVATFATTSYALTPLVSDSHFLATCILNSLPFAFFLLGHLWLLFGEGTPLQRLLCVFAWTSFPVLFYALNLTWKDANGVSYLFRMEMQHWDSRWTVPLFFLAWRMIWLTGITLISVGIRSLITYRLCRVRGRDVPQPMGTRIFDWMALTTLMAIAFSLVRAMDDGWAASEEPGYDGLFELIYLSVVVLPPLLLGIFWRRARPHFEVLMLFWCAMCIAGVVAAIFWFGEGASYNEILPSMFFLGLPAVWVAIVIRTGRRYGYQLGSVRTGGWTEPVAHATWRWNGVALAALVLIASVAFHSRYDLAVLLSENYGDQRWQMARLSKRLTRVLEQPPAAPGQLYWQLSSGNSHIEVAPSRDDPIAWIDASGLDRVEPVLEQLRLERVESLTVHSEELSAAAFESLRAFRSIDYVDFQCPRVAAKGLAAFLQRTQPKNLSLWAPSSPLLNACRLANLELSDVAFREVFTVSPELMDDIRLLPVSSMVVHVPKNGTLSLDGFENLRSLEIRDSAIDVGIVHEITKCSLEELYLSNCSIEAAALEELAQAKIEYLSVSVSQESMIESWLALADSKGIGDVDFSLPPTSIPVAARFAQRRGQEVCDVEHRDLQEAFPEEVPSNSLWAEAVPDQAIPMRTAMKRYGSFKDALIHVAHQYEVDSDGRLTSLNIQGIELTEELASELGTMKSLRKLRCGVTDNFSPYADSYLSHLGGLDLEELEIPGAPVNNEEMKIVGSMTNLRRLQLPVYRSDIVFPERILTPLFGDTDGEPHLELVTTHTREFHFGRLSDQAVAHLSELAHLEYLLMPGYLLSQRSLNTISQLPKLVHFHAPFSVATLSEVARVAKMSRLQSLSIGVLSRNADSLQQLKDLPSLRTLQVFLFGDHTYQDGNLQHELQDQLTASLPDTEIHWVWMSETWIPAPDDE